MILMILFAFGLILTAALIATLRRRTGHTADLGAMGDNWVATHNASRPS